MSRIIDAIEELGELDNALIICIQGDNGAIRRGQRAELSSEMTFFNNLKGRSTRCSPAWMSSAGR
ncbi:MAG: hypothetical protein R3D01_02685 [Hyphomicrobiales bacterium]